MIIDGAKQSVGPSLFFVVNGCKVDTPVAYCKCSCRLEKKERLDSKSVVGPSTIWGVDSMPKKRLFLHCLIPIHVDTKMIHIKGSFLGV